MNREPITLDDQWRVAHDENYYILMKDTVVFSKKKKKDVPKVQKWYFPKMSQVLGKYLQEVPREFDSITALYDKMLEIEKRIDQI